jgi:hypothetical protein
MQPCLLIGPRLFIEPPRKAIGSNGRALVMKIKKLVQNWFCVTPSIRKNADSNRIPFAARDRLRHCGWSRRVGERRECDRRGGGDSSRYTTR